MVEWLKIKNKNGDTYLVNAADIIFINKNEIVLRDFERLIMPIDVEEAERAITESRKTGERWLNG